jgi:cytochrome c-type biogenesis protein CcmH
MAIWMILIVMTALAVMAVLWPLSRHREAVIAADPNTQFYRDQLAEIERDLGRGLLSPPEAEAAKAEAARRLLKASTVADPSTPAVGEPALRRRRAASALALSIVPMLALAVYGAYGSPHLAGRAAATQAAGSPEVGDLATAVAQIEAHLAKDPNDGRGWEVIAPVYLRTGRTDDAVRAYEAALRLLGPDPARLTSYGEALVFAKDGMVPAEARQAFEKALALDASLPKARFYLARAAEQDGDPDRAKAAYDAILAASPADAPWRPMVEQQLARLTEPLGARPAADAVAGMVQGLAGRLESQGGTAEEWGRLIRSYTVLGEGEKARSALAKARIALAQDQAGLQAIDVMARELKLSPSEP